VNGSNYYNCIFRYIYNGQISSPSVVCVLYIMFSPLFLDYELPTRMVPPESVFLSLTCYVVNTFSERIDKRHEHYKMGHPALY
jgi:hypothetical protein